MDFDLSEEQRAIQDTARAFARDEMVPYARQWDEEEFFPADTLRRAAALASSMTMGWRCCAPGCCPWRVS